MGGAVVLFLDEERVTAALAPALRERFTVSVTSTVEIATQFLARVTPTLVIVELDVCNGSSASFCRQAKALDPAPAVLATAATPARVPDVLEAGCDAVLLKPFAPLLFYSRIARLLRDYRLNEHSYRVWPGISCPHCRHDGVTSFEHASVRRAWYACLACKQVWTAAEPY